MAASGSATPGDAGTSALPAPSPPGRKEGTVAGEVQPAFSFRLFLGSAPSAEVERQTQTLAASGRRRSGCRAGPVAAARSGGTATQHEPGPVPAARPAPGEV